MQTYCAPAARLTPDQVDVAVDRLGDLGPLQQVLDLMPELVVLLGPQRQILFANTAMRQLVATLDDDPILGRRLGEALSCRNLATAPSGCGTGEACRTCGALHAMLKALHGHSAITECQISSSSGTAHDLRVTASPFIWQGEEYALVILGDISAEKRREVLERVFFHDVLNTAGGVSGLVSLMASDASLYPVLKDDLVISSLSLVNEIRSQQMLVNAEAGRLLAQGEPVLVDEVVEAVRQLYRSHQLAKGRTIHVTIAAAVAGTTITTDPVLLRRVLGNMVKNALEASKPGEMITIGASPSPDGVEFWCHNPGAIPREIQLQLFTRSFSTKGTGRGIGTYSMKLFGEQYLHGRVGFTSTPGEGTRFFLVLPLTLPEPLEGDGPVPSGV